MPNFSGIEVKQKEPAKVHFKSDRDGLAATVSMWGSESLPSGCACPEEVVILIPGNPGLVDFYKDYAKFIYARTAIPVWTIGHAGHNQGDPLLSKRNANDLQKQLQHKIDFIEKYTHAHTRIYLVGHSVGGWMCAELLQNELLESRIISTSLLFPTLEHIARTPNGALFNGAIRNISSIILLAVYIFTLLPRMISKVLVYIYFMIVGYPYEFIPYVFSYLQVPVMRRCLGLAGNEMDNIKDGNIEVLAKNTHRLKVLFNEKDGWAPGNTFKSLRRRVPNLHVEQTDIRHAFVLNNSKQVADITIRFMFT